MVLKERYCIVEKIAEGGEGTTYLARDLELGNYRAVKELSAENCREADLMRKLEHPSLPKMIDHAEANGRYYIVMEYIRGRSLGEYLREGYEFSLDEIREIAWMILQILSYLHSIRPAVFYGDLKPDNLIRSEDGRIYLVDFGSAVYEYGSLYRVNKGTPGYAAPEQYHGRMTEASDYYGLGQTIEALCGKKKWKYYFCCPELAFFIRRCCMEDPAKRWTAEAEAARKLEKIHPVRIRLRTVLILTAALLLAVVVLGISAADTTRKNPVELSAALTPVTAGYYSLAYRTGNAEQKRYICTDIEKRLQDLLKVYQNSEEQIRIMELLARNGELMNRADRAEIYYRQLLTYEPEYSIGYLEYGMFLCRQARAEESREVYHQWEEMFEKEERMEIIKNDRGSWKTWEKEAGIILGKKEISSER